MKSKFYAFWHFVLAWFVRIIMLIIPKGQKNEPKVSEGPCIICANHISALDPVYICAALRHHQPRFMAKKELFSIPVLSWIISALGAYSVDRNGRDTGVIFKTIEMLGSGRSIGVFPQGTRRPGVNPADTPVKNGVGLFASKSKVKVLPVFILTKNNKTEFLRPIKVIIGKPITYEEYTAGGTYANDVGYITRYVFDRICELGSDGRKDV